MIMDMIKMVEQFYERKELVIGVLIGFFDFDWMIVGLQLFDLIVIVVRSSMGKCFKYDVEVVNVDIGEIIIV